MASNSPAPSTPQTPVTPATPRHSYTLRFKKEVLAALERNGNNVSLTAREFNISRQCAIRWRKGKDELLSVVAQSSAEDSAEEGDMEPETPRSRLISRQQRRRIRKRQPLYPIVESELVKMIKEQRSQGFAVHHTTMKIKARELASR